MKIVSAYTREQFEMMAALGRRIVPDFYASTCRRSVGRGWWRRRIR